MASFNPDSDSGGQASFFDEDDAPLAGPSRPRPAGSGPAAAGAAGRDRSSSVRPWQRVASTPGGRTSEHRAADAGPSELGWDEEEERDGQGGGLERGAAERVGGEETLIAALLRHWCNERCAPEVLMQREDLLEEALDRIKQQTDALNVLLASPESTDQHFRLILIETEVERLRYICKGYARTRMYKLDKYFNHCLSDSYAKARLSQVDIQYCEREQALVHNLLYGAILEGLPPRYRRLDEEEMIVRPDLDQAVFVLARTQVGPLALPDSTTITLEPGSRHFLRYRTVRTLVENGDVQLL